MRRPSLPVLLLVLSIACGGGTDRNIIQNTGSDTMLDVAQAWAERFSWAAMAGVVREALGGTSATSPAL